VSWASSRGPDGDELGVARGLLVLAAAAASLAGPIDGPCASLRDEGTLELEIERARRLGFGGKACIHPDQVAPVLAAFTPGEEDVAWARSTPAAGETGGVAVRDGEMVDLATLRRARRILALAPGGSR